MNELVSIIMPSYNTSKFIAETIRSVLNQTYSNWEMIIVDDCSSDNTEEIVKSFRDSRIRFIRKGTNSGAAVCRNKALQMARGKWVAFLDSDDIWEPNKLEEQISFMEKNNYHFSYSNYVEVDDDGKYTGVFWTGPKKISRLKMYLFNYIGCLTVMYDREAIGLIQIPNLKKRNDYALWIKAVKKHPAYLLDKNLARYRVRSSGSLMNRNKNPLDRMKFNYYLWHESEKMNVVAAFILTMVNLVFGALKKIRYKKRFDKKGKCLL